MWQSSPCGARVLRTYHARSHHGNPFLRVPTDEILFLGYSPLQDHERHLYERRPQQEVVVHSFGGRGSHTRAAGCLRGDDDVAILFGLVVGAFAIVPLFLFHQYRTVTFDIRQGSGTTSSISFLTASQEAFQFRHQKPDEGFLMDYVFGSLRAGTMATHKVSHLNYAALATPIGVELRGALADGIEDARLTHAEDAAVFVNREEAALPVTELPFAP